ncbi:MAG: caspase family protein [Cohaesibacter sp.]|jgi:hypothetical protein|nr:caspase family protein [Cohaesibacter sp.]
MLGQVKAFFLYCLLSFVSLGAFVAPPAYSAGKIYGLTIGINDYAHISDLYGAVNDAKDIAAVLRKMGADEVVELRDDQATRKAILHHWNALTGKAGKGDIVFFHYAGHGTRQEAIIPGHEAFDNMFLLHGFDDSTQEGSKERLIDNEIGHLLAQESEATIIFVADSCFAGGMTRGLDRRIELKSRYSRATISPQKDVLRDHILKLGEVDESAHSNVLWVYAQDAKREIPEVAIDGEPRGVLSYSLARAMEGAANRNGDDWLDIRELKSHLNKKVYRLSERKQRPEINGGSADLKIPLSKAAGASSSANAASKAIRLAVINGILDFQLSDIVPTADTKSADLVYDAAQKQLISGKQDVIADFAGLSSGDLQKRLQGAIQKWRLLSFVQGKSDQLTNSLELTSGNDLYAPGDKATFALTNETYRHVILFNLAYDGTVQLMAPVKQTGSGIAAGLISPGMVETFSSPIIPPFGSDHVIAISSLQPIASLQAWLREHNNQRAAADLLTRWDDLLGAQAYGLDWVGLYSTERN